MRSVRYQECIWNNAIDARQTKITNTDTLLRCTKIIREKRLFVLVWLDGEQFAIVYLSVISIHTHFIARALSISLSLSLTQVSGGAILLLLYFSSLDTEMLSHTMLHSKRHIPLSLKWDFSMHIDWWWLQQKHLFSPPLSKTIGE